MFKNEEDIRKYLMNSKVKQQPHSIQSIIFKISWIFQIVEAMYSKI